MSNLTRNSTGGLDASYFLHHPCPALGGAWPCRSPHRQTRQGLIGIGCERTSSGKAEVDAAPRQVGDKLAICGLVIIDKATSTTKATEGRFTEHVQFHLAGKGIRVQTALSNALPRPKRVRRLPDAR